MILICLTATKESLTTAGYASVVLIEAIGFVHLANDENEHGGGEYE